MEIEKSKHKILMIDLENCPNQIQQLMDDLQQYAQIVVCYAQSGAKIPLDWIIPLTTVVNQNRLKIVKMPNGGKNAADFGITFWAGLLMGQTDTDAHFDIVSDDADLDHAVSLLNDQQRSAKRIRSKKEKPPAPTAVINHSTSARAYCLLLNTHQENRPASKDASLNHIKSKFNGAGVDAEGLLAELCQHGAIKLVDNKISYIQKRITELANPSA